MLDSYQWGTINRISPEAPVPIINVIKKENRLGGAGNVAKNIKSLGAKATLCSIIGKDISGSLFLDLMNKNELETSGIIITDKVTTTKTRVTYPWLSTHQIILIQIYKNLLYHQIINRRIRGLLSSVKK